MEEARQHPALIVALAALLLGASPACAQGLPGGSRIQGDIHRAPDGTIIVTPREAPPPQPAPAAPAPAPAAPAAAAPPKPAPAAAPKPAAPVPASAQASSGPAPSDVDAASCETVRWQPGTNVEACTAQLHKLRGSAKR